jgi:chorismate synthase
MEDYIRDIRKQGDTVGGIVNLQNVPLGLMSLLINFMLN